MYKAFALSQLNIRSYKSHHKELIMMGKASKIILLVLAAIVVLGVGSLLMGSDNTPEVSDEDAVYNDYNLHYDNVKPVSAIIELSKIESKSGTYGFFYETGDYAEPAYSRSVSENVLIEIDISKMKLANDSLIDDSKDKSTKNGNVYNMSHFKKDLKKLLKTYKYPASLELYDKKGHYIASVGNLKVSLKGNVLTVKGSYSNTSEYYTEYERSNHLTTKFEGDEFALNDDFHNVKKARLSISGNVDDRESNRTVNIDIDTKNLKVSSSVSTDFKSTYDK
jgi:hypothetical protein